MQSKLACTNRSLYKPPTSAWLTKVLGTQPNLGGELIVMSAYCYVVGIALTPALIQL